MELTHLKQTPVFLDSTVSPTAMPMSEGDHCSLPVAQDTNPRGVSDVLFSSCPISKPPINPISYLQNISRIWGSYPIIIWSPLSVGQSWPECSCLPSAQNPPRTSILLKIKPKTLPYTARPTLSASCASHFMCCLWLCRFTRQVLECSSLFTLATTLPATPSPVSYGSLCHLQDFA